MTDEVLGIAPGPQQIETLLDAYSLAASLAFDETFEYPRAKRQWLAFRARILARDKEKDTALTNIRDMARSGLSPDVMNYTTEQWQQHKLDYVAAVANAVLEKKK